MGRYITSKEVMAMFPQIVQTAGTTPGELEFPIQLAENEADGVLGRRYNMAVFSGSPPPLLETIVDLLAAHAYLRTQITQEDPSRSDWVSQLREQAETYLTDLVSGTLVMASGSGTLIQPTASAVDQVWSSTMDYARTMTLTDPTKQRVSPSRLRDMDDETRGDI